VIGMDKWGKLLGLTTLFYGIYIGLALLYARWRDARRSQQSLRGERRGHAVWTFEEGRDRVAPRFLTPRSPSSVYDDVRDP
jgi:hypothetical protein